MTEVRFYHLQRQSLEQTLPTILERVIARSWRAVVLAGSPDRVEALNQHLWTYNPDSFLPHGSEIDGNAEHQPIWLTMQEENRNNANVLVLTDGMSAEHPGGFEIVCDLFDGNDPAAVEQARRRWRQCKNAGHELVYFQQTAGGKWEEKKRIAP